MADFDPPFGSANGTKRYPNLEEQQSGFNCGPADRDLFNGLLHRIEAEIGEVIDFAGIEQTNDRLTQLREAIQSMIPDFEDVTIESINGDDNGGEVSSLNTNQFVIKRSDGVTWTLKLPRGLNMLGSPVTLWSTGEIDVGTLPTNYTANIAAHIPVTTTALVVRVFFECDAEGSGLIATESSIRVNGHLLGSAETGGDSGNGDNSWSADFIVPRAGNLVTAAVTNNYDAGGIGLYQTSGKLVGYFA